MVHTIQGTFFSTSGRTWSFSCICDNLSRFTVYPPSWTLKAEGSLCEREVMTEILGLNWGIESRDPGAVRILFLRCTLDKTLQSLSNSGSAKFSKHLLRAHSRPRPWGHPEEIAWPKAEQVRQAFGIPNHHCPGQRSPPTW